MDYNETKSQKIVNLKKLESFFGEPHVNEESQKKEFESQPEHIKVQKLSKRFGERIPISSLTNKSSFDKIQPESPNEEEKKAKISYSKMKVDHFFGEKVNIEIEAYKSKLVDINQPLKMPESVQPSNVSLPKLNKFFGHRLEINTKMPIRNNYSLKYRDDNSFLTEMEKTRDFKKVYNTKRFFSNRSISPSKGIKDLYISDEIELLEKSLSQDDQNEDKIVDYQFESENHDSEQQNKHQDPDPSHQFLVQNTIRLRKLRRILGQEINFENTNNQIAPQPSNVTSKHISKIFGEQISLQDSSQPKTKKS